MLPVDTAVVRGEQLGPEHPAVVEVGEPDRPTLWPARRRRFGWYIADGRPRLAAIARLEQLQAFALTAWRRAEQPARAFGDERHRARLEGRQGRCRRRCRRLAGYRR